MKQAQSVTYDKQADALYIGLRKGRPAKARTYTDDVILHLDGTGHPLGVEVLDLTRMQSSMVRSSDTMALSMISMASSVTRPLTQVS